MPSAWALSVLLRRRKWFKSGAKPPESMDDEGRQRSRRGHCHVGLLVGRVGCPLYKSLTTPNHIPYCKDPLIKGLVLDRQLRAFMRKGNFVIGQRVRLKWELEPPANIPAVRFEGRAVGLPFSELEHSETKRPTAHASSCDRYLAQIFQRHWSQ